MLNLIYLTLLKIMKRLTPGKFKQIKVEKTDELSEQVAEMIKSFKGQDKKGVLFSYHLVPKKMEPVKDLIMNYLTELGEQEREIKGDYSRAVHTGKILASYALFVRILSQK